MADDPWQDLASVCISAQGLKSKCPECDGSWLVQYGNGTISDTVWIGILFCGLRAVITEVINGVILPPVQGRGIKDWAEAPALRTSARFLFSYNAVRACNLEFLQV